LPPPKVTVVITTFNRPQMLSAAISSVLNQTLQDFEIIVVDDVSTENNVAVIDSFGDERITLVRNEKHLGGAVGRNVGVAAGHHSEWVAFLDDDDLFLPDKLEKQVALGESQGGDYAVIYCGVRSVDGEGNTLGFGVPDIRGDIRAGILDKGLRTFSSTHLFRRSTYDEIGGYDSDLRSNNEHDIWMKMGFLGLKADFVADPLVITGQHRAPRMTSDPQLRVGAVKAYLHKWESTYVEWMGERDARKYRVLYVVRVLGPLAATTLATGNLRNFFYVMRSIIGYGGNPLWQSRALATVFVRTFAHRFLPLRVLRGLRRIKKLVT
jgi:glycosyltransferase involved in cell wall biosynthesis